jgi:hypothetical protein
MSGALVHFPTRRRALARLGLDSSDKRAAIDAEIRRIDNSIDALRKVKAGLLAAYRKEMCRELRREAQP